MAEVSPSAGAVVEVDLTLGGSKATLQVRYEVSAGGVRVAARFVPGDPAQGAVASGSSLSLRRLRWVID